MWSSDVTFEPKNMYRKDRTQRNRILDMVVDAAPENAERATVVSVVHGLV